MKKYIYISEKIPKKPVLLAACGGKEVICNQQWISNAHTVSYCTKNPDSVPTERVLKKENTWDLALIFYSSA